MPSSLPAHVAAANAKQGREWREEQAAIDAVRCKRLQLSPEGAARWLVVEYSSHPADLLAALRTVSGEEEFGADPGRTWIERVTGAVEDLVSEEEG